MEFAIITSPRKPFYLHDTVRSLRETGLFKDPSHLPVRLLCSRRFRGNDADLKPYRNNKDFSIEQNKEAGLPVGAKPTRAWNGDIARDVCVNHRQGVLGFLNSYASHLCIFEDDVKLSHGWMDRLDATLTDIETVHGNRWILTLFARDTDEPLKQMRQGRKWYYYEKRPYWGTLGTIYPRDLLLSMPEFILNKCIMNYEHPIDELVGYFADENKIPFLASAPSLVQHIGDISSGISKMGKRIADGFLDDVRSL